MKKTATENKRIPEKIVEKAIRLNLLRPKYYAMKDEIEGLANELREYVTRNAGEMLKIENRMIEVWLEPNQRVRIQPKEFYKLLKDKAFDFMEVKREQVEKAIKVGSLDLDPRKLGELPIKIESLEPRVKVKVKK